MVRLKLEVRWRVVDGLWFSSIGMHSDDDQVECYALGYQKVNHHAKTFRMKDLR